MNLGSLAGVSVVMPVLNEAKHLQVAVNEILSQSFDGPLEVVLALGPSTDQTNAIANQLAALDSRIKLVLNPSGKTPTGLNLAIAQASHDVIVRVDGHSILTTNYIKNAVDILNETGADVVGGVMAATGQTKFEMAVASAMRSALGVGPARFHTGGKAGETKTVYLGVFRRSALLRVGGYDESFIRAQDWEMNYRIRSTGGKIWFDPRLEVTYRPRSNIRRLAKQYFEYGRWRREVARTYPETKSLRYLAPPFTVAALVISTLLLVITSAASFDLAWIFWIPIFGYLTIIAFSSLIIFNKRNPITLIIQPIVLLTMHMCWGVGFLTSPRNLRVRE